MHSEQNYNQTGSIFCRCAVSQFLIKHPVLAQSTTEAAVLISFVWNVHRAAERSEEFRFRHLIGQPILQSLKQYVKKHGETLGSVCDVGHVLSSPTLRDFDNNFSAKQSSYPSVKEYYDEASIGSKVHLLSIPVYALGADDDPLQPGSGNMY